MTVREFIGFLDPTKVLDGRVSFKVILHPTKKNKWGDKWFFYHDKKENPLEDTVKKFCNNEGIVGCMDKEIDYIECHPDWEPGLVHYHMEVC